MSDLTAVLEESRRLGFLGPGPIEPHLIHSSAFAEAVETEPARALDLGAGGGLPGLVLAYRHWTRTEWTLLDAQSRRTTFLEEAVARLGIESRVRILWARAEDVGREPDHRGAYDVVTARSFAAPAVTAECAAPFLRRGGTLIVSEPPEHGDSRWRPEGLAELGLGEAEPVIGGRPGHPVHLMRIGQITEVSDRYPRRTGVPAKRPLF